MKKKTFKVMIRQDDQSKIREVKGYFTWLNDLRVFIYNDIKYHEWYVIDLVTGLAIATGFTMAESKKNAINRLGYFKEFQEKEKYKNYRFEYQKLLKEFLEKGNL